MDIDKIISLNNIKGIIPGLKTGLKPWHQAKGSIDPEEVSSWGSVKDLPTILMSVFSG